MHVNLYKKLQIKTHKTPLKVEKSILFLDYLDHFISNAATKRVQGYGTVGLAHNTIRTYKSLFRIVKAYEFGSNGITYYLKITFRQIVKPFLIKSSFWK